MTPLAQTELIPQPGQRFLSESDEDSCIESCTASWLRPGLGSENEMGSQASSCATSDDGEEGDTARQGPSSLKDLEEGSSWEDVGGLRDAACAVRHSTQEVCRGEDVVSEPGGYSSSSSCTAQCAEQKDSTDQVPQRCVGITKAKFQELKRENILLITTNQILRVELFTVKQEVNKFQLQFRTLQEEHTRMKAAEKAALQEDTTDRIHTKLEELQGENSHLKSTNQNLTFRVSTMKQEMNHLQLKLKTTEDSLALREAEKAALQDAISGELLSLKKEKQEMMAENDLLKMTLDHMNVEMSHCQTRLRRLCEKEEEMRSLRMQIQGMVKENEELQQRLNECHAAKEARHHIWTHIEAVMDENNLLKEHLRIQETNAQNINQERVLEEEARTERLEKELRESKEQLESLRAKCKTLTEESDRKITAEIHASVVNELKSQLLERKEREIAETEELREQLRALQEEVKGALQGKHGWENRSRELDAELQHTQKMNSKLQKRREKESAEIDKLKEKLVCLQEEVNRMLLEKHTWEERNKELDAKLQATQKINRKQQKKIDFLRKIVEHARWDELTTYQYLSNLLREVEKVVQERDALKHLGGIQLPPEWNDTVV